MNNEKTLMGFCFFCHKGVTLDDDYVILRGPDGSWIRGCAHHTGVVAEHDRQDNQMAAVGAAA